MLEVLTSSSNAEPFFDGYTNKNTMSYSYKNHTAPIKELERIWENEWGGKAFFSHGTKHSKGVITLINPSVNFKVENVIPDKQGSFIILKLSLEEKAIVLVKVYTPNDVAQQVVFFKRLNQQLEEFAQDTIVNGGDFNCALTMYCI